MVPMNRWAVVLFLPLLLTGCAGWFGPSFDEINAQVKEQSRQEDIRRAEREKEWEADWKAKNKERRQAFVDSHPKLSKAKREAILEGSVFAGMSAEEVAASFGDPERNNRTAGKWGMHEQWVYAGTYVYFENGVMTSWQDRQ